MDTKSAPSTTVQNGEVAETQREEQRKALKPLPLLNCPCQNFAWKNIFSSTTSERNCVSRVFNLFMSDILFLQPYLSRNRANLLR